MENVVVHSDDFAEQFIVGSVTQFVECQYVEWTVSVTSGAVYDSVDVP